MERILIWKYLPLYLDLFDKSLVPYVEQPVAFTVFLPIASYFPRNRVTVSVWRGMVCHDSFLIC